MNPEGASLETRGGLLCSSLGKIPSLGNLSLFLRFLTDWMRPTNVMEYKLIYSKATIEMLLLFSHLISSLSASAWTPAHQASLSFTISQSFLKLMSFESVIPSNHLILCHPHLLLPSVFPSIRVFSSESLLHIRQPKCCRFSLSISPSNEYSGLISLEIRIEWFDLLAVQGTLKSLQYKFKSINSLVLSLLYGPTCTLVHDYWKNHSFDYMDFR